MNPIMMLIHSPLVGPYTWALVADRLRLKGITAVVPTLTSSPTSHTPYWQQHADAAAQTLAPISADQPVLLVGHSGAGPLLPAIRQAITHPMAGYVFMDAGWPVNGKSRLDLFENAEAAKQFRKSAEAGFLPTWSEVDLASVIPDDWVRKRFVHELRPLPLAVYEEALPVFSGWPDAPCGYLRFGENPAYDWAFAQAQQAGCQRIQLEGEHFHMLVDPDGVTETLLALTARMGIPIGSYREDTC